MRDLRLRRQPGSDMRLDKFLADMGCGTRSEIKQAVCKGRVTVGGQTARDPAMAVDDSAEVTFDGLPVRYQSHVYIMMNKPDGVVSATEDPRDPTVIDLLKETAEDTLRRDLFPAGRLDKDTEGLVLLTNDGELAHRLLSPKRHVDKIYYAVLDRPADEKVAGLFESGIEITDSEPFRALPAKLELLPGGREVLVTIREGKYHQVKRMFAQTGITVTYLKRLSMGPLQLDADLASGAWRMLTEEEIAALKSI